MIIEEREKKKKRQESRKSTQDIINEKVEVLGQRVGVLGFRVSTCLDITLRTGNRKTCSLTDQRSESKDSNFYPSRTMECSQGKLAKLV